MTWLSMESYRALVFETRGTKASTGHDPQIVWPWARRILYSHSFITHPINRFRIPRTSTQ